MNFADFRKYDVTNGPGVRATLFVSGCTHNCPDCFNYEQQNFNYGKKFTLDTKRQFISAVKNPLVTGVSILGGEPFQQGTDLLLLLKEIKSVTDKPIWVWTGSDFDKIRNHQFTKYIDVIIDGKFEKDKKDLKLLYRGSSNQRIIDVKKSLESDSTVLYEI